MKKGNDNKDNNNWRTMASRLAECLSYCEVNCNNVSHHKTEYHSFNEPCPIVQKVIKTLEDYDNMVKEEVRSKEW